MASVSLVIDDLVRKTMTSEAGEAVDNAVQEMDTLNAALGTLRSRIVAVSSDTRLRGLPLRTGSPTGGYRPIVPEETFEELDLKLRTLEARTDLIKINLRVAKSKLDIALEASKPEGEQL